MGKKLIHLPVKRASITPAEGKPFVRKQHYNPNKKQPVEEGTTERTDQPTRRPVNSALLNIIDKKEKGSDAGAGDNAHPDLPESLRPSVSDVLSPKTEGLRQAEYILQNKIPEEIMVRHKMREITGKDNMNGIYMFQGDEGDRFYWKPKQEEQKNRPKDEENEPVRDTIQGDFWKREIVTYEDSKLLGVEGLVTPTKKWQQQMSFGSEGMYYGSAQLSVHDFAKILGYEKVGTLPKERKLETLRNIINKIDNISDLVTFDFITGQTDRHPGNLWLAQSRNKRYNAIVNDNGLSQPEHEGDMIHPD